MIPEVPTRFPQLRLINWILNPIPILENAFQHYGENFILNLGRFAPFAFFSDPKAIEQIFQLKDDDVSVGTSNRILRRSLGDNSILLLDGDRHQRQRQLLMPPFHGERMRAYGDLIGQITRDVLDSWTPGNTMAMRPEMQAISIQVIIQAIFGVYDSDRAQQLRQCTSDLLHLSTSKLGFAGALFPILQRDFGAWSPGGKFVRLRQNVDELIYAEINERRSHPDPDRTDVLNLLLSATDEQGQGMSDVELRDELMTLLLAGHETTATALSWAVYWIYRDPELLKKLRQELTDAPSDAMSLMRLPLLNAVCMETLRIYPVAFIAGPRLTLKPVTIMGQRFEANVLLTPCIYLTHHRPDLYPDADTFRPERFLDRQFSAFEFFPFGGGNRRCIGSAFAMFEMKLVLAELIQKWELAIAESNPVKPVRRGVTIAPETGIQVRVVAPVQPEIAAVS
jgi:cytochrome P450